ncbi:MAG: Asp23/Gls24 family envelope stress response protein [Candidatus Omnitrophica bacterium]|nr:Asp23/Gls24 family envelope stress response protein [Candidatus Omnitrophota bacterium]
MRQDMTDRYRTTDLGAVKINNNAITTIASIAAMEIKGVSKIGGGIGKTLFDFLCKKGTTKGVKIIAAAGDIKLTVYITVEYGVDITRIADEVQENVKMAVEKMTGLVLSGVDVVVEGVKSPFSKDKTGGC